jgi:hypothetical protein
MALKDQMLDAVSCPKSSSAEDVKLADNIVWLKSFFEKSSSVIYL